MDIPTYVPELFYSTDNVARSVPELFCSMDNVLDVNNVARYRMNVQVGSMEVDNVDKAHSGSRRTSRTSSTLWTMFWSSSAVWTEF